MFDIVRFTECHRAVYVNLQKHNTHKISRIFRTECQKSFRSYVHQHSCAEKLLDVNAKDTAIEFMYINMHVRGNSHTFGTDSYER